MARTRPDQKPKVQRLPILRPLGKSEQLSAVSHALGFFKNVGMSAHYSLSNSTESPDLQRVVYAALADVVRKNAILSAIPVDEASPEAYFARLESIDLARCVFWRRRTGSTAQGEADLELDTILEEQHNTDFKTNYGDLPFWRLIILQDAGSELSFTASFIFHHSLGDGATGSIFHTFFLQALNTAISQTPFVAHSSSIVTIDANIQLLSPLEQLHPLPINENLRDHRADGGKGLKEWFGNPIHTPLETHYKTLYFSPASTTTFAKKCKHNGTTVTSSLTAVLAGALLSALPEDIEALTGIIPINLRPWLNLPANSADGAMGSFIDAMKVQIRRSQYEQADDHHEKKSRGLRAAHHTSQSISSYLATTSPTGEPYTSIAPFKLIPDVAAVFSSLLGTSRDAAFEEDPLERGHQVRMMKDVYDFAWGVMVMLNDQDQTRYPLTVLEQLCDR
ncbi:uncharacterized protein J4E88_010775 [Alternaria novae-zelandiae]|uniref:uncharacterized protein n=1 Tax=Alternaria novae-zelandiae TaxID=430562 RepID=UPI0020C3ABA0|nr:uncharacterized protein J4E88_010775 [Alternaria novae-zelandiae]KAI4663925.1 hypothetical protein J4E88_010775 [Alternaria novae-zelandiae]